MNLANFDKICKRLSGAKMIVQWRGSHVYKIGGKVFAIGNTDHGVPYCIFKTSPLAFEILLEQGQAARAPYLTRGQWVMVTGESTMPDAELADYLQQSHTIIAAGISKTKRQTLGIM